MNPNWQSAMSESSLRNIAIAAGTLYLITHVTSIGAVILYSPILNNANYVLGAGADALVILGAIFDIVLTLAIAGTAVALHPVVKQWGEGIALGYVGLRILEAGIIAVGVVPLLVVVTMRQYVAETAIADPETLMTVSHSLVAFYNETALLGPGVGVRCEHRADGLPDVQVPPRAPVYPGARVGWRPRDLRLYRCQDVRSL